MWDQMGNYKLHGFFGVSQLVLPPLEAESIAHPLRIIIIMTPPEQHRQRLNFFLFLLSLLVSPTI